MDRPCSLSPAWPHTNQTTKERAKHGAGGQSQRPSTEGAICQSERANREIWHSSCTGNKFVKFQANFTNYEYRTSLKFQEAGAKFTALRARSFNFLMSTLLIKIGVGDFTNRR